MKTFLTLEKKTMVFSMDCNEIVRSDCYTKIANRFGGFSYGNT